MLKGTTSSRSSDESRFVESDTWVPRVGHNHILATDTSDSVGCLQYANTSQESDATGAASRRHFELFSQPIVSTFGQTTGRQVEILLAMTTEAGSPIRANRFLTSMQRLGMTTQIDKLVLRSAVSMLEAREGRGLEPMLMCGINLAGSSLCDPEFERFLETQLIRLAHPEQICFEVTETELIPNLSDAASLMTRIKRYGCRFALDDFGNGLCSFAYLKRLPIDVIKIDGQFIKDCPVNRLDREIVESIYRLSRLLDLETVAECVETEVIYDVVRDIGIDSCQGYYFGHPRSCRTSNI